MYLRKEGLNIDDNYFDGLLLANDIPTIEINEENKEYTIIENQTIYVLNSNEPFIKTHIDSKFVLRNSTITRIDKPLIVANKKKFISRLMFLFTNNIYYLKETNQ